MIFPMTLLLLACTGPTDDNRDDTGDPFGGFRVTDANNYRYDSAIDGTSTEVQIAADFTLDWSGLTVDLLGHPMDPATEVDMVWLVQFGRLTQEEVQTKIVADTLLTEDASAYVTLENVSDATSCALSEFRAGPVTTVDPTTDFTDADGTWMTRVTTGSSDTRMLQFLRPTVGSSNHDVTFGPDSAILTFNADLHSLQPFAFAEEPAGYALDWSGLTTHANGNPLVLPTMDQLLIGRYDGLTVADLESRFIDIETIASETFIADVYGRTDYTAVLSEAVNADGVAFSGFGAGSLWIIALQCTVCANPAPPFVTVVEVAG